MILVLNSSSVAVLWFGSGRIDNGQMQIGALIAFLSYLAQIILAVMMPVAVATTTSRLELRNVGFHYPVCSTMVGHEVGRRNTSSALPTTCGRITTEVPLLYESTDRVYPPMTLSMRCSCVCA